MKRKRLTVLLIAIAYVATNSCKDLESSISVPKTSSPVKNITNSTIIPPKTGTEVNKKSQETYSSTKDNETVVYYAPKFKYPTKMYKMDLKPAGTDIKLKCIAEGNPTPNITWYKNQETPILRRYFAASYGKWSLTLNELTKMDNGHYTCVVCNQLGCIEHTTQLKVQERYPSKPYIKEGYPGNATVLINENVTLTCPPISDLEPFMSWIGPLNYSMKEIDSMFNDNGNHVTPIALERNIIESENPEDKSEQLTLYNVTKKNEGWYVCFAVNSLGNTMGMGYVKVLESLPLLATTEQELTNSSFINIITAVFGGVLFVAAMVVVTTCRKLKREMKQKQIALETARDVIETYWKKKVTIEKPHINNSPDAAGTLVLPVIKIEKQKVSEVKKNTSDTKLLLSEYELPLDEDWEVPRETVVLGKVLGEGEFGKVVKAECVGVLKRGLSTVAVKMLKDGHTDTEITALVSEMEIMKIVGKHVNIINLLGCCTQGGPLYVIVEFALYGSLREFLHKHRPGINKGSSQDSLDEKRNLTPQDLVSFAYQAAKGMEYLASRHCLHRDLAARNILVSENFILKIADFGLAKNIENEDYYRKKTAGKLPVRWMAPESLNNMLFTIETDVWSFGVLLWEIMTFGATPYRIVQGQYMYEYLSAGHRLGKPPGCRLDVYMLMRECWSLSPKGRPTFTELVKELDKILTTMTDQEYLDLSLPESDTSKVTKTRWLSNKELT